MRVLCRGYTGFDMSYSACSESEIRGKINF